jgi:hypothetical protein
LLVLVRKRRRSDGGKKLKQRLDWRGSDAASRRRLSGRRLQPRPRRLQRSRRPTVPSWKQKSSRSSGRLMLKR